MDDVHEWLTQRLADLGMASGKDLSLIQPEDLAFESVPERERFDRHYPRRRNWEGIDAVAHYEPHRKQSTVEKVGGRGTTGPQCSELPPRGSNTTMTPGWCPCAEPSRSLHAKVVQCGQYSIQGIR